MSFFSLSEVKAILTNIAHARRQWEAYAESL